MIQSSSCPQWQLDRSGPAGDHDGLAVVTPLTGTRSPGTELSFANELTDTFGPWNSGTIKHKTAIFREINQGIPRAHHDALEFPDGQIVLLTLLQEGQQATVLQLPATHESVKAAQPDKAKV